MPALLTKFYAGDYSGSATVALVFFGPKELASVDAMRKSTATVRKRPDFQRLTLSCPFWVTFLSEHDDALSGLEIPEDTMGHTILTEQEILVRNLEDLDGERMDLFKVDLDSSGDVTVRAYFKHSEHEAELPDLPLDAMRAAL